MTTYPDDPLLGLIRGSALYISWLQVLGGGMWGAGAGFGAGVFNMINCCKRGVTLTVIVYCVGLLWNCAFYIVFHFVIGFTKLVLF